MIDSNVSRMQEGGAGRIIKPLVTAFPEVKLTAEQLSWIENYYKNVCEKGLF